MILKTFPINLDKWLSVDAYYVIEKPEKSTVIEFNKKDYERKCLVRSTALVQFLGKQVELNEHGILSAKDKEDYANLINKAVEVGAVGRIDGHPYITLGTLMKPTMFPLTEYYVSPDGSTKVAPALDGKNPPKHWRRVRPALLLTYIGSQYIEVEDLNKLMETTAFCYEGQLPGQEPYPHQKTRSQETASSSSLKAGYNIE